MKLSRRALFGAAFGATQLALLDRFAPRSARAAPGALAPTRYLGILVRGGLPFEQLFAPLSGAGIAKFIPKPIQDQQPFGYLPKQVQNWDGSMPDLASPNPKRKIRGPIYWKSGASNVPYSPEPGMNPLSDGVQKFSEYGYALADPKFSIFRKMTVLAAVDQGTAAHLSGVIGSTCGVSDNSFRAPAVAAVIANFLSRTPGLADRRPLANVVLGTTLTPSALNLPSSASPARVANFKSLANMYSERNQNAWKNLSTRGADRRTKIDEAVANAFAEIKGTAGSGADADYGQLLAVYEQVSKALHKDVVTKLENTKGWELLHNASNGARYADLNWGATVGYNNGPASEMGPFDTALRLLKSDLVTAVTMQATSVENYNFDAHRAFGLYDTASNTRVVFEQIARMLIEMDLTPSGTPGKSLLDDTLVYVYSDFGRTFPKSFNTTGSYKGGSDHHPATCAVLAGGGIGLDGTGNMMIGGYDESTSEFGAPMGVPVEIREETGEVTNRAPRSQDVVATICRAYGMDPGKKDFFLPGGFGEVLGAVPNVGG
jgi:hypothetical protein